MSRAVERRGYDNSRRVRGSDDKSCRCMIRAVGRGGYDKSCRERGIWQELQGEGAMIRAVRRTV